MMNGPTDEIDVADPRYVDRRFWLGDAPPDICLRLTDPHAAGAVHACDATLRVVHHGEDVTLEANMGYHTLGILWGTDLLNFLWSRQADGPHPGGDGDGSAVRVGLYDWNQREESYPSLSGIEIVLRGEELSLEIGQHCFGVARGPIIAEFFRRAWLRATYEQCEEIAA
jgi:hypothetical protein